MIETVPLVQLKHLNITKADVSTIVLCTVFIRACSDVDYKMRAVKMLWRLTCASDGREVVEAVEALGAVGPAHPRLAGAVSRLRVTLAAGGPLPTLA